MCIYRLFGREITKYTVIYGVCIRFWPALHNSHLTSPSQSRATYNCTYLLPRHVQLYLPFAALAAPLTTVPRHLRLSSPSAAFALYPPQQRPWRSSGCSTSSARTHTYNHNSKAISTRRGLGVHLDVAFHLRAHTHTHTHTHAHTITIAKP